MKLYIFKSFKSRHCVQICTRYIAFLIRTDSRLECSPLEFNLIHYFGTLKKTDMELYLFKSWHSLLFHNH